MLRLVLWLRMVGFTSLFVATALGVLSYQRRPFRWLRSYLILLSAMAVFDLSFTFVVFSDLVSGSNEAGGHPLFVVLQAGVSVLLLYAAPRFVQRVRGTAERRGARLWAIVPVTIVTAGYVLIMLPLRFAYDRPVTILYYGYLGGWFLYGWLGRRDMALGGWRPWITAFLGVAGLWHVYAAVVMIPSGRSLMRPPGREDDATVVPEEFVREFKLSSRER